MAIAMAVAMIVAIIVASSSVMLGGLGKWLIVLAVAGAVFLFQRFQKSQVPAKEQSYLSTLYHQVYGQYGWNEGAGPHQSTEPVPIRASRKVLSREAFAFLEAAATQAMRIHGMSATPLGQRSAPIVDSTMKQFFELIPALQGGGTPQAQAQRDLVQLREIADHLCGVPKPLPAETESGLSSLESLLFDARAEHQARMELSAGQEIAQQQQ